MPRLLRVVTTTLVSIVLAGLLGGGGLRTVALAATPLATASPASVTGVWSFETNDTPDNLVHFTLLLRQQGTRLTGFDTGGEPVRGNVTGRTLTFTVYGVSSEDDYGGQGTLGPNGRLMSGSFWDGYGFTGLFGAVKLAGAG